MDINSDAPVITRDEISSRRPSRPSGISRPMSLSSRRGSRTSTALKLTGRSRPARCFVGDGGSGHHFDGRGGRRSASDRVGRSRARDRRRSRLDPRRARWRSARPDSGIVGGRCCRRPTRGAASRPGRFPAGLAGEPQARRRGPSRRVAALVSMRGAALSQLVRGDSGARVRARRCFWPRGGSPRLSTQSTTTGRGPILPVPRRPFARSLAWGDAPRREPS